MKFVNIVLSIAILMTFTIVELNAIRIKPYDDPLHIDSRNFDEENLEETDNVETKLLEVKETRVKDIYNSPGYILPYANIDSSQAENNKYYKQMRFTAQNDDYFNPNQKSSDPMNPGKEIEMIRQEGLSNGVVIVNKKRTANFETGEYPSEEINLEK